MDGLKSILLFNNFSGENNEAFKTKFIKAAEKSKWLDIGGDLHRLKLMAMQKIALSHAISHHRYFKILDRNIKKT